MFGIPNWRRLGVAVLGVMLLVTLAGAGEVERKAVKKVQPGYPELARQTNVSGVVRVEVVIASNGSIKTMRPLGGHPLLIRSATEALKNWRYEPGPETTTILEFRFH
jgi:TonB family protein